MTYYKCDYAGQRCKREKRGWCTRKKCYCDGNGLIEPFDDIPEIVENKDVCKESSLFNNCYILLNNKLIEALKKGKIVGITNQECNIFIRFEEVQDD